MEAIKKKLQMLKQDLAQAEESKDEAEAELKSERAKNDAVCIS